MSFDILVFVISFGYFVMSLFRSLVLSVCHYCGYFVIDLFRWFFLSLFRYYVITYFRRYLCLAFVVWS